MKSRAEIVGILTSSHRKYLASIESARKGFVLPILTADDVLEMRVLSKRFDENPIISGVPFWDGLVGSFRRGNLYVLAGYAGTGKTTLAVQLSWAIAKQNRAVWFYCLELTPIEVMEVLAGHIVEDVNPTDEQYVLANTLAHKSGFRFFDSTVYRTWEEHLSIITKTVKTHAIEMVVIDNFHYLTRVQRNATETEGVASQRLKGLAQECNIPVLLLHHLRKPDSDSGEPDPTMHALRGASALLNDASAVVLLHHPLCDTGNAEEGERQQVGKLRYAKARWGKSGTRFVELIGHKRQYIEATHDRYKRGEARKKDGFKG
jgi:replicative DNA helicase